ncbi:hypothetical protein [Cryptosporangium arvum]|uniref:hypothetical protein n=1 Tax=Cryptosporangium arvum TaxID=80871 RepID=UPI0004BC1661|nr:hypothetical protein [Cryptosporangium arvum]
MSRTSPLFLALAGVVVLLGGAFLLGGTEALAGAAVGLGLVAAFLASGRLPFLVDAQLAPGIAYLVLGINYLFRVVLLLVALVALKDQPWLDARALGLVVIAGALVWNVLALRRHLAAAARNTTSEVIDGESPDVNTKETTTTSSDVTNSSATRTVGGGR